MRQSNAELLGLKHGSPLMPRLRDQSNALSGQIITECLERIQVGVWPEQMCVAVLNEFLESVLQRLAFGAKFGKPCCKYHGKFGLFGQDRLKHLDCSAYQDDC